MATAIDSSTLGALLAGAALCLASAIDSSTVGSRAAGADFGVAPDCLIAASLRIAVALLVAPWGSDLALATAFDCAADGSPETVISIGAGGGGGNFPHTCVGNGAPGGDRLALALGDASGGLIGG